MPLTPKETLKVGAEMLYTNFTDKGTRDDPTHSFVIGPTIAWKPSRVTHLDVAALRCDRRFARGAGFRGLLAAVWPGWRRE